MLLTLCQGHPPVTSGFPSQRPVMQSFDVFFEWHLNKQLSKQLRCWSFEMPLHSLSRHCNDVFFILEYISMIIHFLDILEKVPIYTCARGCVIDNVQIKNESINITPACFLLHTLLHSISFHLSLSHNKFPSYHILIKHMLPAGRQFSSNSGLQVHVYLMVYKLPILHYCIVQICAWFGFM